MGLSPLVLSLLGVAAALQRAPCVRPWPARRSIAATPVASVPTRASLLDATCSVSSGGDHSGGDQDEPLLYEADAIVLLWYSGWATLLRAAATGVKPLNQLGFDYPALYASGTRHMHCVRCVRCVEIACAAWTACAACPAARHASHTHLRPYTAACAVGGGFALAATWVACTLITGLALRQQRYDSSRLVATWALAAPAAQVFHFVGIRGWDAACVQIVCADRLRA